MKPVILLTLGVYCIVIPLRANPTKGQTHTNYSRQIADKLFECVSPFRGVGAQRVRNTKIYDTVIIQRSKISDVSLIYITVPRSLGK